MRLLEKLQQMKIETHLVLRKWASVTLKYEKDMKETHLRDLATFNYAARDLAAPISSGSFLHDGMIIVPSYFLLCLHFTRGRLELTI